MLVVQYVERDQMPKGHWWMLSERDGVTTASVVDGAAEKVARAVYSSSRNRSSEANASAIRSRSADW